MDYSKVVEAYLNIRDKRAEMSKEYTTEDDKLKAIQKQLEGVMLGHLNDTGLDSARTPVGTFFRTESLKPSGSDWTALYEWIRENDAFEALERRIKRDFIKEYMETHDGELPPGVSVHREYECRVRRA